MLKIAIIAICSSSLDLQSARDGPLILQACPLCVENFAELFCEDILHVESEIFPRQRVDTARVDNLHAFVWEKHSVTVAG
jgi:hypothetical protein